jgi:uncharacterized protein (DUF362 family)
MTAVTAQTHPPRHTALVAVGAEDDIASSLTRALEQARAEQALDAVGNGERPSCRVVIRPVLAPGAPQEDPPLSYADPVLVEALVEWLRERGWENVTIAVAGPGGCETARRVGYQGEVVDLSSASDPFHYGGLIGDHAAARTWREADVRILVGKARTDRQLLYAGALIGALGCIPDSEQLTRRLPTAYDLARCSAEILEKLPVAFGLVDAWRAADGAGPPSARDTRAVLASSDLFALDWVLGELMDLDGPELCPVVKEALYRRGAIDIERRGDLTEWTAWSNPGAARAMLSDIGAGRWWGRLTGSREVPWTAR